MSVLTQAPPIDKGGFTFDNSYARLPERFFQRILPVPVKTPNLICLNNSLLEELGLNHIKL